MINTKTVKITHDSRQEYRQKTPNCKIKDLAFPFQACLNFTSFL